MDRLLQLPWITKEAKIELDNWGKPFLHPQPDEILHIVTKNLLANPHTLIELKEVLVFRIVRCWGN